MRADFLRRQAEEEAFYAQQVDSFFRILKGVYYCNPQTVRRSTQTNT